MCSKKHTNEFSLNLANAQSTTNEMVFSNFLLKCMTMLHVAMQVKGNRTVQKLSLAHSLSNMYAHPQLDHASQTTSVD